MTKRRVKAHSWPGLMDRSVGARAATGLGVLDRRALHRAVTAKDTAIAWLRPKQRMARLTLVEELAGIRRHVKLDGMAALGTGQGRARLNGGSAGSWIGHVVASIFHSRVHGALLAC